MRSQLADRLGVQAPQIEHRPPDVVSLAAAEEAIELADSYGVANGHPLAPSQRQVLELALGERADGSWAATRVVRFGPRQGTGKNDEIAARELAGLILFGERLIVHTAHELATARESFRRLEAVFENWDDLRRRVARFRYSNEEQGVELVSGQRLIYKARSGKGQRGFAEVDLTVYDEGQHLQAEHLAASAPAKLANPNAQTWLAGSGGLATSTEAWRLRKQALAGVAGRLAYAEHTAEVVEMVDGEVESVRPDPADRDAWYRAMPGLGRWVTEESMQALFDELGPELFARECLCVWDPEPDAAGGVFPAGKWKACFDPESGPTRPLSYAVDVSPDRSWASIAVAAKSGAGTDVELVDRRQGTAWLPARAAEVQRKWGGKVAVAKGSPAWSLKEDLDTARVDVLPITPEEHTQACGDFYDAVVEGQVRHIGQAELDAAVVGADRKYYGDSWLWSRRTSTADISPLVAVTLAHWLAQKRPRRPGIL